jgi:hypothetical protein
MEWSSFISGVIGAFFGGGAGGILLKIYLDHRLTIERSELAEKRLQLQKQQDASVAVVEILGEWVRSTYLGEPITNEQKWQMQTTYWKNILLLDKSLIDQLFPLLAQAPDSVGTNEMIVQARRILLGLNEPDIKATDLNNWLPTTP